VTTDSSTEIPCSSLQTEDEFSKAATEVTTDLGPSAMSVEESHWWSASACELYRETIQLGLSRGRNAMGIWQDLVDSYGFEGGYQSVKRFVRKLRGTRSPEARVTAAEELLEIIMRRYERTSTLLTSNRPVEDWGKLFGDSAAVTAMLDRLLHHGHILNCGPRSWRTKSENRGEAQ
jgi:hypothetical protein